MTKPEEKTMELLSPAGSFESLMAALAAGADAVYMGGPLFGARAFAENPEGESLLRALDYAHLRGKKVYLTVNTLLKERERKELLYDYMAPIVRQGLDGVIVQDLGVLAFLRDAFPGLPLHASTQMAVSGAEGARLLKKRGVKRLVLPRELSLKEIELIGRESGLETEVFVHGALCYCWSGRCLMSSFLGGRSGNRGRCAQPCRLSYEGGRLMNMRDLCGLEELPALKAAGVCSLKIEGRMKSPEYTAGVTAIYRKYLDRLEEGTFRVEEKDRKALSALFDRGGFTEGYYRRHNGADMLDPGPKRTHVSLAEGEKQRIREAYLGERPLPIHGFYELFQFQPARLRLEYRGMQVQVEGALVEGAQNQPLSAEKLRQQLMKTGGSDFVFQSLEGYQEENCFLPLGALNELRRRGLEALREKLLESCRQRAAEEPPEEPAGMTGPRGEEAYPSLQILLQLDDPALLDLALKYPVEGVYLPADYVGPEELGALAERIRRAGKKLYYALP
ncbi:MAG: U32 family peptidase, partial [Lachnospiraceae bacterium]|nr:U32 family peptidase [Lachnospiraceae bacterium]